MKILLIDDEEFVRVALGEALQAEGCHVTRVSSGDAGDMTTLGLERLAEGDPHKFFIVNQ